MELEKETTDLAQIYFPESIYIGWMSVSFILITLSLLFYHMTRTKSLLINTKIAGCYAAILILISCAISFISIFPYYSRFNNFYKNSNLKKEKIYHTLYVIFGFIVILIELLIAATIIKIEFF